MLTPTRQGGHRAWRECLLDIVHGRDGFPGIILVGVPHEAESPAAASVAVFDDDLMRRLLIITVGLIWLGTPAQLQG